MWYYFFARFVIFLAIFFLEVFVIFKSDLYVVELSVPFRKQFLSPRAQGTLYHSLSGALTGMATVTVWYCHYTVSTLTKNNSWKTNNQG